jgi:hypothetical protein
VASLVIGAIGAGIGSLFGNPMLGWELGTTLGGILMPMMAPTSQGRLSDVRVAGASYGLLIPQGWGEPRVGGIVIWAEPLIEHKPSGGSGGSSNNFYSYSATFAVMIAAGPVASLNKIYAEDLVIYDSTQSPPTSANITVYLGDESQTQDPLMSAALSAASLPCPAHRGYAYVVFNNLDLTNWSSRIPNMSFDVTYPTDLVADVITDVLEQAGVPSDAIDVTQASSTSVGGYVINERKPGTDQLASLMTFLAADLCEYDGKIVYVPRGGSMQGYLNYGDLAASRWESGVQPSPAVKVVRKQDRELPVSVELTYFSNQQQNQAASQRAVRYDRNFQQDAQTVQVPVTTDDTTARQEAERMLYTAWVERTSAEVMTSVKWLCLAPSDVISLTVAGQLYRMRVDEVEHEPFGAVRLSLTQDDNLVLNQVVAGAGVSGGKSPFFGVSPAIGFAWNGPALRDEDADTVGVYFVATGAQGWGGCTVYVSFDNGNSWNNVGSCPSYTTMGVTLSSLAAGSSTADFDEADTVDVQLSRGLVGSEGYWYVINGANACMIGQECLQFSTVTVIDLPNLKFRLGGLLRGQRGTDAFWSTHSTGEQFCMLDDTLQRKVVGLGVVGKSVKVAFVTPSTSLGTVTPITVDVQGYELYPYAPCTLTGARDMSGNLTMSWFRRAREGGAWADYIDVPLDEPTEQYEVDVYNGSSVVRTLTTSSGTSTTYTAADQVTDFGSPQSLVAVKVYMVGQLGRGFPLAGSI